ncbi:MAG: Ig-like domain-containing protein, partial [Patescibacteria group bacterium]
YENPKFAGDTKSGLLAVTAVVAVADDTLKKKATTTKIKLSGKALPNSFVTIFIYSEPIVVTVKTDESGAWTYTLDKELSDGTHEVYSAITDTGGRILAKSEPLPFIKEAAAVSFGSTALLPSNNQAPGFFSGGSLFALIVVLIGVLGLVFVLIGVVTERHATPTLPAVEPGKKD